MQNVEVLRQILLITDGCSNEGADPVQVALLAARQGVGVSVIGVLDEGVLGLGGEQEIIRIAEAGQGMYRLTRVSDLSRTVQIMTQRALELSVERSVLSGWGAHDTLTLDNLPPALRPQLAREMENAAEIALLDICLVIDLSGSMNPKRRYVQEAVRDLVDTLSTRKGNYQLEAVVFPDPQGGIVKHLLVHDAKLADAIGRIEPQGNTPTGPALALALQILRTRAEAAKRAKGRRHDAG